jgi:type IV secretion system protein VirB1
MLTASMLLALAQQCAPGVSPLTLTAIVQVESAGHPFVINSNTSKKSFRFNTPHEAAAVARQLLARGDNIDIGLGQVNSQHYKNLGLTPERLMDGCTNLRTAGQLLTEKYAAVSSRFPGKSPQELLRHALSRYNTGDDWRGFRNGYVAKVEAAAARLLGVSPAPYRVVAAAASPSAGAYVPHVPSAPTIVYARAPVAQFRSLSSSFSVESQFPRLTN